MRKRKKAKDAERKEKDEAKVKRRSSLLVQIGQIEILSTHARTSKGETKASVSSNLKTTCEASVVLFG